MKNNSTLFIGIMIFVSVISYGQPGSLDGDFDADGKVTTAIGSVSGGQSVVIQPDGKIIIAGISFNGADNDFAVVRYNIDGSLDNSFNVDGIVTTDFAGRTDLAISVALQADGKIVAAGYLFNGTDEDFAVARYHIDGSLDTTFGAAGFVTTDFAGKTNAASSVAVQADGKIIVAGNSNNVTDNDFAVVRYNMDGSLDNSFSVDGIVTADFAGNYDIANSVVVQADGKIVAAGTSDNSEFAVVRYNTDGTLDNTFGVAGKVTTTTTIGSGADGRSVVIQPDGKIIVAGYSNNGTGSDIAVVRYNTDGKLDNSFDADGVVTTTFGIAIFGYSCAIQPDGKIVVAGQTGRDFAVVRYNLDGSLDNSFGVDGIVTADFAGDYDIAYSVVVQADGKIIAAGQAGSDFAVARYISGLNVGVIDFTIQEYNLLIYPNPLLDNAVIEYTLADENVINIDLYDVSGRLIQSIVNSEERVRGSHKESLNLDSSVPSGSYILTISNGQGSSSISVIK